MGRIVGIDLGTTNSLVAYIDPVTNAPKCILGPNGSTLCPSVVSVDADGSVIVGEPARRRLLTQSERSIYSVKRLMGRGVADIQDELKLFPFRISAPGCAPPQGVLVGHQNADYSLGFDRLKTSMR